MSDLQTLLRRARERAEHTQTQAAEEVGVATQTLAQWEQGRSQPGIPNLRAVETYIEKHTSNSVDLVEERVNG